MAAGIGCEKGTEGRFAIMCIAPPPAAAAGGNTAAAVVAVEQQQQQQAERWSIVQEAARRRLMKCIAQERGWVPRRGRESWLGLMWEVESLRRGAVFGRSHAHITLSEGGSVATRNGHDGEHRTAASKAVMRAGRHYAQFTTVITSILDTMSFGVIRPGWDVEGGEDAPNVDGHCFYATGSGHCYPGYRDWEGMQRAMEEGDRVGLLLDLDQGTMTVYKNDERLGVMATGLSGEYSWAVSLWRSARIDAAELPAAHP